ncbi:hypothetical protein ACFL0Y_03810 [Patescibacteria group bacterium]
MDPQGRKILTFLIATISVAFLMVTPAFAHPGRTASDDCHYCKTNCSKWGVPWDTRHCHGGVPIEPEPEYIAPVVEPTLAPQYIAPTATPTPRPTATPTPKSTATPTLSLSPTETPASEPTQESILTPEVKGVSDQEGGGSSTAGTVGALGTMGVVGWGGYKIVRKLLSKGTING